LPKPQQKQQVKFSAYPEYSVIRADKRKPSQGSKPNPEQYFLSISGHRPLVEFAFQLFIGETRTQQVHFGHIKTISPAPSLGAEPRRSMQTRAG
jgi:hypothetical protein